MSISTRTEIPTAVIRAIFGTDEPGTWDARQQGQIASWAGEPRESNPWNTPISRTHLNCAEWYRGWEMGV